MEDVEAWILGMNKLFELHDYTNNMKAKVAIFSLNGKVDIWWEDVKWVLMVLDPPKFQGDLPGKKSQLDLRPFGVGVPAVGHTVFP